MQSSHVFIGPALSASFARYRENKLRKRMDMKRRKADIPDTPFCTECGATDRELFYTKLNAFNRARCKACQRKSARTRLTKDRVRRYNLRRLYNVTPEEYDAMTLAQNGVCACCGEKPDGRIGGYGKGGSIAKLVVDHDHHTGEVKALLCADCNCALGYMKNSPERIKKLLIYAEKYHAE
jgi:hypothetical protein